MKKENQTDLESLRVVSKNWTAEQWEEHLLTLEVDEESTPVTELPFEFILNAITKTVFELETREPYSKQFLEAVKRAINDLPDKRRSIIEKIFFEGQTEAQVADFFGISQPVLHRKKIHIIHQIKNNPHVRGIKLPIVGGNKNQTSRCPFERIDNAFEQGEINKDEKYRLWALYEVGALRRFV